MKWINCVLNFTKASENLLAFLKLFFKEKKSCMQCIFVSLDTVKYLCALTKTTVISMTDLIFLKDERFTAVQRAAHLFTSR